MNTGEDAGQEGARNNKRQQHCTTCKNHGQNLRKSTHKCQYESCECLLCQLTRLSRLVMRHQQRLWRHLKDAKGRGDASRVYAAVGAAVAAMTEQGLTDSKLQKCDMCRNHGIMKEKRAHKNTCPYQDCACDLCNLTRKRRDIMRHQQRVRRSQVTSQQRDEAYNYVIQTKAELAQMSMESSGSGGSGSSGGSSTCSSSSSAPASNTPAPPASSFSVYREAATTTTAPSTTTPTCRSACVMTQCTASLTPAANAACPSIVAPVREHPSLELLETRPGQTYPPRPMMTAEPSYVRLVGPSLYHDVPYCGLNMRGYHHLDPSPAWRDLKRDRSAENDGRLRLFRETDAYRGVHGMDGHTSTSAKILSTSQDPIPFRTTDSSLALTVPSKKTRFANGKDPQQPHDDRRFWGGSAPTETSMSRGGEEVHHARYQRRMVVASASPEARLRSPPALLPLPQSQPIRPRPVRPPTYVPGMHWDHVNLPYFAQSLLHGHNHDGTLST